MFGRVIGFSCRCWAALLGICGLLACNEAQAPPRLDWVDAPLEPMAKRVAFLGWQVPEAECRQAYRIDVSYDTRPFKEPAGTSHLMLGRHPDHELPAAIDPEAPIPTDAIAPLKLYYHGLKVAEEGIIRDAFLGRRQLGPAAPTAACTPRTWDPLEDAATLGWPLLPGRLVSVGESWSGARVEGRCNKTACIDLVSHAGGPESHHRACVTVGWQEQLVGLHEIDGQVHAAIKSTWTDGHGEAGIWAERRALISVDHGRPVWVQTVIHHGFPVVSETRQYQTIERTWTMRAVDECPGSLTAAGVTQPADPNVLEQLAAAWTDFERYKQRIRAQRQARKQQPAQAPNSPAPEGTDATPPESTAAPSATEAPELDTTTGTE